MDENKLINIAITEGIYEMPLFPNETNNCDKHKRHDALKVTSCCNLDDSSICIKMVIIGNNKSCCSAEVWAKCFAKSL